jgi:hypothetical protein
MRCAGIERPRSWRGVRDFRSLLDLNSAELQVSPGARGWRCCARTSPESVRLRLGIHATTTPAARNGYNLLEGAALIAAIQQGCRKPARWA